MDKNTVLLRDTEAFMRGELDNVTVAQNSIVLDLVQGSYVPYGCYTSAPLPMPLFDALRVSWNAASPDGTAVEAQCRVLVDGNWTQWVGFGKWSPCLHREGVPYQERGPVQRWHDHLQLDSKCATMVQLRIYLYTRDEKASPLVTLLGASTHVVDVIPARGRPVNARMHMMPYAVAHRAPALRPWMDLAIALASLTNRWGADLLPEEFAQVLRDWRTPDDHDPRSLSFAAAAAARWGFPAWVAYGDLALLRAEARAGYGAVVRLQAAPAQTAAGMPETRYVAVRGLAAIDGNPQVLLCDPWAGENDFDCETAMPLDDFMVAWDNVALLMRQRTDAPARPYPVQCMAASGGHRCPRSLPALHQRRGASPAGGFLCAGRGAGLQPARCLPPRDHRPPPLCLHRADRWRHHAGAWRHRPQIHGLRHRNRRQDDRRRCDGVTETDEAASKNACRGEHCSPAPVCL